MVLYCQREKNKRYKFGFVIFVFSSECGRDNHLENWCQKFPWQKKLVSSKRHFSSCSAPCWEQEAAAFLYDNNLHFPCRCRCGEVHVWIHRQGLSWLLYQCDSLGKWSIYYRAVQQLQHWTLWWGSHFMGGRPKRIVKIENWYTKLICKSPNQAFLFFQVIIENPLVSHKDPEKGEKFCPMTPRQVNPPVQ